MDRNQAVQLEQVRYKYNDAIRRCMEELDKAQSAESEEEYKLHLDLSTRAGNDAATWYQVLASIS